MIQQTSNQLTLCVNIPLIYIYIGESSWCFCLSRRKPFKQVDSSGGLFNYSELPEPRDKKALAFFQRFTGSECSQCCISLHFTPKTSGRTSFCRYESAEDSQNVGCLQTSLFQLVICLRKRLPLASFIENHSNRLTAVELLGTIESYMNHVITCRRDHSVSQLSFSMALGQTKLNTTHKRAC